MQVKPGTKLRSRVCSTEVVVVRAPKVEVELRCGGQPMVTADVTPTDGTSVLPGYDAGTQIGKRYADAAGGIEVLSTKGGQGSLSLGDEPLVVKDAKSLPSSD
jgi:hypothetical protein